MKASASRHAQSIPAPQARPEPVDRTSSNLRAELLEQLKALIPEAITEGRVDWDAMRAALGELVDDGPERYSFTWAGKRDALRALQTPSRATLIPDETASVEFSKTGHVFVEGENLETLKLLYRSYFGRVKMIYLDVPYNTGNDFVYPDDYADSLGRYLELTGQRDTSGNLLTSNPETGGRYHSSWLSMMYPRLFLARQLLRDDGVIFVSIDDHEAHNLRVILNEIFGEESFLACFIWHRRQMADSRNQDRASTDHEYVLAYRNPKAVLAGKNIDTDKYTNPDGDPRGPWFSADITGLANKARRPNLHYNVVNPETGIVYPPSATRGWSCSETTFKRHIEQNRILWPAKPDGRPRLRKFLDEVVNFQTGFSSMLKVGFTTEGTREIQDLFGEKVFPFPKPVGLVKTLVEQVTAENDIILDFFAGSATTAQAVLEQNRADGGNRRFVLVQLPEPTGNADFPTIADIAKERVRRVIARLKKADAHKNGDGQGDMTPDAAPEDLGMRVFRLAPSHFRTWSGVDGSTEPEAYLDQLEMMTDPLVEGWTEAGVLWEVIMREGLSLTARVERLPVGENVVWRVMDPDRDQVLHVCLDRTVTPSNFRALGLSPADLFVCRDAALTDKAAANLALECRLKTI